MDIQVLKSQNINNTEIFNVVEYKDTEHNINQTINNEYVTIVQESDITVGDHQEVYLSSEGNMAPRSLPINIINISDDQILRIEFQNESGIINTEYIMNDNLLTTQFVNECENMQEVTKDSTRIQNEASNNESEILSAVESLTQYSDVNLSLPSPETDEDIPTETDLTSLNWLHNITNIMSVPNLPTPPISPPPNNKKCNNKHGGNCQEDLTININYYKKNGDKKPPFSYATLICMAMSRNGNKMTLSAIYSWIRENFLYYRKAHPSWQVFNNIVY